MLNLKKFKSSTALALAIGMSGTAIAPLAFTGAASAQPRIFRGGGSTTNPNPGPTFGNRIFIGSNNRLPVNFVDDKGETKTKVVVGLNERLPITLSVADNLAPYQGRYLIPRGTKIEGEFEPSSDKGGTRFIAKKLVFSDGTKIDLNASSDFVGRVETIRQGVSTDALLKGAAIGSGAATIISGVTGDRRITLGKILIGTAAGALGGLIFGRNTNEVYSVTLSDLNLRLREPLPISLR
jgi:hypothetical protein